jgi:DNA-binding protein Fis
MVNKSGATGAGPQQDRREEIMVCVHRAVKSSHEQIGTELKGVTKEAEEYILSSKWSVDEIGLEMAVKRACVISVGSKLEVEDFDLEYRHAQSIGSFIESRLKGFMRNIKRFESFNLYDMVIPEVEKSLIMMVLKETKGNQIKASRLLGINRNTLRSKIKKLGIKAKSL